MTENFKKILKKINRNADGDTMIQLYKRGVKYRRNYGVKVPIIKKIAKDFTPDTELALELWESNIREMRILAGFLQPVEQLTLSQMEKWALDFNNIEIVEQTCINLFSKSNFAIIACYNWFENEQEYIKTSAFLLSSLLIKNLTAKERTELEEKILQLSVTNSNSDSLHVKNALSRALVEIAKVDMQNNQKIKDILNLIKLQNTDNTNFIIENTEFQIDFFGENLKSI